MTILTVGRRGARAGLLLVVAAVAVLPGAAAPVAAARERVQQIHVAPWGDDAWPGTHARPFATPARAQREVRTRTARMRADIVVNLRGGTYQLAAPLELSDAAGDSGRHGHRVRYQAYGYGTPAQERVVLSGGRRVTGWRPDPRTPGIWRADVGNLDTRQLYVDGRRAPRAALGRGLPGRFTTTKTGYVVRGAAPAAWRNPGDVELVYRGGFGKGTWPMAEARCGVAAIHRGARSTRIVMDQPCYHLARLLFESAPFSDDNPRLGHPTDVENSPSFLRRPGSFYLDRARHVLYYAPRPGQDMRRAHVVAPVLETLVRGAGTRERPLHDVSFLGLTFAHATWRAPSGPGGFPSVWSLYLRDDGENAYTVPGTVVLHHTARITVQGNRFTHLGAQALEISKSSTANVVEGNVFTDLSAGAVVMGVVAPDTTGVHRGNRIANNWVHDVGVEYRGSPAIWTALTQHTTVAHNQVNDVPYSGILSGPADDILGITRGNRILHNRVHNTMQVLDDGGGIYLRGEQGTSAADGAVLRGNFVTGGRRDGKAAVNIGIYTDDTSDQVTVRGNVVHGYVAAVGGCADPYIRNMRLVGNYWDATEPLWPCGDPENVTYAGNTPLSWEDPAGTCAALPECARIAAHAGLQPHYRRLLLGR